MEVFYLKMNFAGETAQSYLKHWLDLLSGLKHVRVHIVCNGESRVRWLKDTFSYTKVDYDIMHDYGDHSELKYIVENAIDKSGHSWAYTQLTPLVHASETRYKNFWVVNADSIGIYMPSEKFEELLRAVKEYAFTFGDILSLDFYHTASKGKCWNFSVSYVDNTSVNWIEVMEKHCRDGLLKEKYSIAWEGVSVDWFFTYLKEIGSLNLETFSVDNLRVIHHCNDVYRAPCSLRYFQNDRLYFPTLSSDFRMNEEGSLPIQKDVIRFDVGLTEKESVNSLLESMK